MISASQSKPVTGRSAGCFPFVVAASGPLVVLPQNTNCNSNVLGAVIELAWVGDATRRG
jgi:hypothetical protein